MSIKLKSSHEEKYSMWFPGPSEVQVSVSGYDRKMNLTFVNRGYMRLSLGGYAYPKYTEQHGRYVKVHTKSADTQTKIEALADKIRVLEEIKHFIDDALLHYRNEKHDNDS